MTSVEANDLTCQNTADFMSCDAMFQLAKKAGDADLAMMLYRNEIPSECERYGKLRDNTLEMELIGAQLGGTRKNECTIPAHSAFGYSGLVGGDIGNDPRTMFLEWTKRHGERNNGGCTQNQVPAYWVGKDASGKDCYMGPTSRR